MSSKYLALQPIAYGVLDGLAQGGAKFVGPVVGMALLSGGQGSYQIALDPETASLPANPQAGGYHLSVTAISGQPIQAVPSLVGPTSLEINATLAGSPTDTLLSIVIWKYVA